VRRVCHGLLAFLWVICIGRVTIDLFEVSWALWVSALSDELHHLGRVFFDILQTAMRIYDRAVTGFHYGCYRK
jgi:hypothetical protein